MGDKIYVHYQEAESEFVEKRSRFIGHVWPVDSEDQAQELLRLVKKQHYDARHNCWCYLLGGSVVRYSDDGEPQGTAGQPMLAVFQREHVTNVLCVVTRYFGGILLGAGGLVRAYSHGAKIAVDAAKRKLMTTCTLLSLEMDYSFYGKINYILPQYTCRVEDTDFGAVVTMKVLFKQDQVEKFVKEVTELSAALVVPQVLEERFDHFAAQ